MGCSVPVKKSHGKLLLSFNARTRFGMIPDKNYELSPDPLFGFVDADLPLDNPNDKF
jgi:hypothetical protein